MMLCISINVHILQSVLELCKRVRDTKELKVSASVISILACVCEQWWHIISIRLMMSTGEGKRRLRRWRYIMISS